MKKLRLAIDTGGTFTDVIALDEETQKFDWLKTPSTPDEPSVGVMNGVDKANIDLSEVTNFVHGSTLAINACLERKGAKTGIITTKGFRDIFEIGRTNIPESEMYNLLYKRPPSLVPRYLCREITERVNAEGEIVEKLDEEDVKAAAKDLLDQGVESVAVCLLHSYANPDHEKRVGEIIRNAYPRLQVSLSHIVCREYREYERTSSTVIDAYTKPIVENYLENLEKDFLKRQFKGEFFVTRSGGGAMGFETAREYPIHTIFSGPAGGLIGANYLSKKIDQPNLLTVDMGGTSFDTSLIVDGEPETKSEAKLEALPILLPVYDIRTIGAGGGSIAWIDSGGLLRVGPESAGADPGPVSYGQGGTEPTVTDSAVCLGYIDPDYFLGGEIKLDLEAGKESIKAKIADPLGKEVPEASEGIISIVVANMAGACREIMMEKGYDPRDFALFAFGGAGPMFATNISEELGIPTIIIPPASGNFSALGMLMIDTVHDFSRTFVKLLQRITIEEIEDVFKELEEQGEAILSKEGISKDKRKFIKTIDMRYKGQEHTVNVPVVNGSEIKKQDLKGNFEKLHERRYGHRMQDPAQIVHLRVRALGVMKKPELKQIKQGDKDLSKRSLKGERKVFNNGEYLTYKVINRENLLAGNILSGPAIIEEPTSTAVIHPNQLLKVDKYGNLIIKMEDR